MPGHETSNNLRRLVETFFKHCFMKIYIATDPMGRIPHFRGVGHRWGSGPSFRRVYNSFLKLHIILH